MVLRVYAMWNQSRTILAILLLCYFVGVIFQVVTTGIFDNPDTYLSGMSSPNWSYIYDLEHLPPPLFPSVMTAQVHGFSVCYTTYNPLPPFLTYSNIEPSVFVLILLILALVPTMKQSIEMYKVTKRWQPNRYMSLLAREGVFYLFMYVLALVFIFTRSLHPSYHCPYGAIESRYTNSPLTFIILPNQEFAQHHHYDGEGRVKSVKRGLAVRSQHLRCRISVSYHPLVHH